MQAAKKTPTAGADYFQMYTKQTTNLSRVFLEQITTLQKMRGQGQQKIVVEKVNVEPGGKAAIGINEEGAVSE